MKKFIYTSDTPCYVSIKIKNEVKEFTFFKNEIYELPANDSFIKSLVSQNKLKQKTLTTKKNK